MREHHNNVGVLRLLFASLVIIGHAPEMVDGNRTRDPINAVFGTLSLGTLAVDAFFLISGYLITKSMFSSASVRHYLERRVLRIYPAFVVAYLLSVYGLGPLVGAHPWNQTVHVLGSMLALRSPPEFPGQLAGLPYPSLNGSLWSIAFEFRCYLLVAALWAVGLLRHRRFVLGLTVILAILSFFVTFRFGEAAANSLAAIPGLQAAIGKPSLALPLTTTFLIGACFYLYRDAVFPLLGGRSALLCCATAAAAMYHDPHFAELGLTTFGAAALFWLAYKANLGPLQRINDRWDVSYGVYLYGWPVAIALLWFQRDLSPWTLASVTLPIALACGAISWWGLERWSKDLFRSMLPAARRAPYLST